MKVLLIGGTGIISTDCTLLAAQKENIDLYLLNRGKTPSFLPDSIRILHGDVNDTSAMTEILSDKSFDVVCDFISYTPAQLDAKLNLFRGKCGQYVFISSVAAYDTDPNVLLKTEENTPVGCTDWSYGLNKTVCERHLKAACAENGIDYTIVRPAYTYNDVRFFNPWTINHWQSWTIANRMLTGKPVILHDDGMSLCTMTHTRDFAKGFVGLWGNPKARNEEFHLTGEEYLTWRRVAEIQGELLGVPVRFSCVPRREVCMEVGYDATQKINHTCVNECWNSAKIRAVVPEFQCTTNFRQGMVESIHFYREHPEYQQIDAFWDACFDRLAARFPPR